MSDKKYDNVCVDDIENKEELIKVFGPVVYGEPSDVCPTCKFQDARGITPCNVCTKYLGDGGYFPEEEKLILEPEHAQFLKVLLTVGKLNSEQLALIALNGGTIPGVEKTIGDIQDELCKKLGCPE